MLIYIITLFGRRKGFEPNLNFTPIILFYLEGRIWPARAQLSALLGNPAISTVQGLTDWV